MSVSRTRRTTTEPTITAHPDTDASASAASMPAAIDESRVAARLAVEIYVISENFATPIVAAAANVAPHDRGFAWAFWMSCAGLECRQIYTR
jgi:hypothetical protein